MSEPTYFERMRVQMQYAVPLIRDLQAELGEQVVIDALERRVQRRIETEAAPGDKADFGRMAAGTEMFAAGNALDFTVISSGDDHFDMDVHECAYARLMDELDARDLGPHLICNNDFPAAARLGMELERTQTKMQGATHCDFRYRRRAEGDDD